ncbi:MAG: phospho-sugar mutase [Pirellulales bacterium]|nr:phospho-sugar mutase [Pirellulales bacterium]
MDASPIAVIPSHHFADQLQLAAERNLLSPGSIAHLRQWLTEPRYAEYVPQIQKLLANDSYAELEAAFWTTIPFGTAGRRGTMYPVGPNAINDRTIGESARGLADYLLSLSAEARLAAAGESAPLGGVFYSPTAPPGVAIGYDTRHRSRDFARLCAEILAAAGLQVAFLEDFRATPELAFTVRALRCQAGVMISASHNPPTDNAIKVFGPDGAQIRPPFDELLIAFVNQVVEIPRLDFDTGLAQGRITLVQASMDRGYQQAVLALASPENLEIGPTSGNYPDLRLSPRIRAQLKILYTPLHGVGLTSVAPVLQQAGFTDLEVYQPHAAPDGDFPHVRGHVANPENPAIFDDLLPTARRISADLILASDPDADRLGALARRDACSANDWTYLTGNQIGGLLGEWLLARRRAQGKLSPRDFVVKTLVTSDLLASLAADYGIQAVGDVLTGFKWIGQAIDHYGPEHFLLGTEEAHGYLAGTYIRDKDAAVAALLLAEFAAALKNQGKSLVAALDELYLRVGLHLERSFAYTLPGAAGMQLMEVVLSAFRTEPPDRLAGQSVATIRDYQTGILTRFADKIAGTDASDESFTGPRANMLVLESGNPGTRIAIRPSGTEPKLKFYLFATLPPGELTDLPAAKVNLSQRLENMESELRDYVNRVISTYEVQGSRSMKVPPTS